MACLLYVSSVKPGIEGTVLSTQSWALEEGDGYTNYLSDFSWDGGVLYCMTLSSFKESLNFFDLNSLLISVSFDSLTDIAEIKIQVKKVVARRERWREAEGGRMSLFGHRLHEEV